MTKKLLVSVIALELLIIMLLTFDVSSSFNLDQKEKDIKTVNDIKQKTEKFFYSINRWFDLFEKSLNRNYINNFKNVGHCFSLPAKIPKIFGRGVIYIDPHDKEPPLILKLPKNPGTVVEDNLFFTRKIDESTSLILTFDKDDLLHRLKEFLGCKDISLIIVTKKNEMHFSKTQNNNKQTSFYHNLKHVNVLSLSNNENQLYGIYATINKGNFSFPQNFWILIICIFITIILILITIKNYYIKTSTTYVSSKTLLSGNIPKENDSKTYITKAVETREDFWEKHYVKIYEKIQTCQEVLSIVHDSLNKQGNMKLVEMIESTQKWLANPFLGFLKSNPDEQFYLQDIMKTVYMMWDYKITNIEQLLSSKIDKVKIVGDKEAFLFATSSLFACIIKHFAQSEFENQINVSHYLSNNRKKLVVKADNVVLEEKEQKSLETTVYANRKDTIITKKLNLKPTNCQPNALYKSQKFLHFCSELTSVVELFEKFDIPLLVQLWDKDKITLELILEKDETFDS